MSHPPGAPPPEKRCKGVYSQRTRDETKAGQRCEAWAGPSGYCGPHKPLADEQRCTARLSKNHPRTPGERCTCRALPYRSVCAFHGGKTPNAIAGAERREAEATLEAQVRRQLARLDVAPVDNPFQALAELAGQVVAWKDALADHVNQLTELRYQGGAGEQLRAEVALFERALDRCNTVLGTMGRLNIDDRLAAINEKQAETVIAAIEAVLEFLDVTGEQAVQAKRVAARKLRAV